MADEPPPTLGYEPPPTPSVRRKRVVRAVIAAIALAVIATFAARAIRNAWERTTEARAERRFKAALEMYQPPAGVLAWSNDPADVAAAATQPSGDLIVRGGTTFRRPPAALADGTFVDMMPLAIFARRGGQLVDGKLVDATWREAITFNTTFTRAIAHHDTTRAVPFFYVPAPLATAGVVRMWTAAPTTRPYDPVHIPIEVDGRRMTLVVDADDSTKMRIE